MDLFLSKEEKDAALSIAFDNLPQELIDTRGFTNHLKQLMDLLAFRWEFADGAKSRISLFADTLRWSESTVRKYIKHAETLGWLCVERTRTNNLGGQTTNRYWLDWAAIRAPVLNEGAPVLNEGAPVLNEGAPVLNEGAPVLNEGAPVLNEGPYSYLVRSLSSSETNSLVCVSSDKEEHTHEFQFQEPDEEIICQAIAAKCELDPALSTERIEATAERIVEAGYTAEEVAAIEKPKWMTDRLQPRQLLELLPAARKRLQAKHRQEATARRQSREAELQRANAAAAEDRERLMQQGWARLPPDVRRSWLETVSAEKRTRFRIPENVLEDQAKLRWWRDCRGETRGLEA